MARDSRILGLASAPIVRNWGKREESFGYEALRLIRAGREIYGEVLLINPFLVAVELPRGGDVPILFHDGEPMPRVDSLIIRSARRLGEGLSATIRCLALLGCDILDPLSRHGKGTGSKLTTSIRRFSGGVGSSTWLAFSHSAAKKLAEKISADGDFPLIAKPIAGRGGMGIVRIDGRADLLRYIRNLYGRKKDATLLLQPFEDFTSEFRVMVFFGESLGIARKLPAEGSVAANAAQGGIFVAADRPDIVEYSLENVDNTGILGVDVGETSEGGLRIIEANRAPRWEAFDKALETDTARNIVLRARKRLD